jgi:hypothetical protein
MFTPFAVRSRRFGLAAIACFVAVFAALQAHGDPIYISTPDQLDLIGIDASMPLSGNYMLKNDLNAGNSTITEIGSATNPFTGTFNGNNHTIANLSLNINGPDLSGYHGLFSTIGGSGSVTNLGLTNVSVIGSGGYADGSLVGYNFGTVSNSFSTGSVSVLTGGFLGGLVGFNSGTVLNSHSSTTVVGQYVEGGLVGYNTGLISRSYATGPVSTDYNYNGSLGGLAGYNAGQITRSYATGDVRNASNFGGNGGLVGFNTGSITQAYARGSVTGGSPTYSSGDFGTGGLVGVNIGAPQFGADSGLITQTYATGRVQTGGETPTGGLVGAAHLQAATANSYWDRQTTAQEMSAGGTPQTTDWLKSGAPPTGFESSAWSAKLGLYPSLFGVGEGEPQSQGPTSAACLEDVANGRQAAPALSGYGKISGPTNI